MDDLILAARLFEKGRIPNLKGRGTLGRGAEYVKDFGAGVAGRLAGAVRQKLQPITELGAEGQALRNPGVPQDAASALPVENTTAQNRNITEIDPSRVAAPPTADVTAAGTNPAGIADSSNPNEGVTGLAPEDTAKRTETTTQTLATTGENAGKPISTETNVKDQTVADLDGDGDSDADDEAIAAQQSPDPNTNATPTPSGPTSPVPPMNTASTTTQNAAGAAQVANAQRLANSGFGGIGANIATLGGAALMGGINRWRGNRKLNALANAQPGAGGATNANMIRADGTEFLDDHWNLQKARMEARERATTEAIRNAYR